MSGRRISNEKLTCFDLQGLRVFGKLTPGLLLVFRKHVFT